MKEISMIMNRKYSFVVTSLLLLIVFMGFYDASSLPSANEEVSKMGLLNGEEPYCSLESCQELRERVESLEVTVRAIVSALSDEENRHFESVSQKIRKNRAARSVILPSSTTPPSADDAGERDQDLFPQRPKWLLPAIFSTSTQMPPNLSSKLLMTTLMLRF